MADTIETRPRLTRASKDVTVFAPGGVVFLNHAGRTASVMESELLQAIINGIPEAHTAIVALIDSKAGWPAKASV